MVGEKILQWLTDTVRYVVGDSVGGKILSEAMTRDELDAQYKSMSPIEQSFPATRLAYEAQLAALDVKEGKLTGPVQRLVLGMLDEWVKNVQKYDLKDPAKAKETLAALTADVMSISGSALGLELALGAGPNNQGPVTQAKVSEIMAWLGFGAVVTAVAHDPVKIGLLRPYQDTLEATFRNRRPGDVALFQAYRTRELSPVKVDDLSKLDEKEMDRIEADNESVYFREISKWGYSEWFATALSRSATRTLNFSQLVTLARAGIYDKGLAIYSLWGDGLDRVVMPASLKAIETLRDREMYSGFRSMIEPSYVEGDISEADMIEYWNLAGVPKKVQEWVVVRLRKRREKALAKLSGSPAAKERDLTQAQISAAYVDGLISRPRAKDDIIRLGYDAAETEILLSLADQRIKTPSAAKLKRLPLSDYEKAWKANIISADAVIQRMTGEYDPRDIDLERQLMKGGKA